MKRIVVLLATLLLSFGLINAQPDYGEIDIVISGPGWIDDTLRTGLAVQLDISLLNDTPLGGMSCGFEIWSPDGAGWVWQAVPGGYGPLGIGSGKACVELISPSRMDPNGDNDASDAFDMTGLLVTEYDVNELNDPNDVL
ncbi:MAG: hypothetical protein ACYS21_19795, partial [Planctomycetota bacterium]